ncbi:caspase family protein [Kitasatospora sp. MMS16-BH015]|uniref:caspase family protein n=1 Tax=Kitasatospora sp. MMS16-BH015 TaxID=2018025 RepID=UPI000CF1CB8E|nr:caspase family protein [Kitasatospora sp. MMS16-BH015]
MTRHLIAVAVTRVAGRPDLDRPELAEDVQRLERLFGAELGYRRATPLRLDPSREQLTRAVRAFALAPERRPEDHLVLYLACHGLVHPGSGEHYLLLADSDEDDLRGTALRTGELAQQLQPVCGSGVRELPAADWPTAGPARPGRTQPIRRPGALGSRCRPGPGHTPVAGRLAQHGPTHSTRPGP